ncbi:hypothetical protein QT970_01705 [Microcoleus sp. herbarium8]|uniref:hypothetical protein n=1 Tax=Microcoleus sp. herbarium8 TaxID=3055436 RepID=UPI002FD21B64
MQPCTHGHTYEKTAKHRQELLEKLMELDREYRTMKYTIVIQCLEEDRCFDALRTKKPGFLTETEGFNGVFSLKNPVSDHPCVRD